MTRFKRGRAPNPLIGYEADTVGSAGTRNYQGMFVTQLIKTAGKLQVQQTVKNVDLMNAHWALRHDASLELLTQVRRQHFALLVARESIRINEAVVRFAHELYRIQVDQVSQEVAAMYEPAWPARWPCSRASAGGGRETATSPPGSN